LTPEQPEFLLRLEALRRDIDSRARRAVWLTVAAMALSFLLGYLIGRFGAGR
jgi:hypothetical protein